MAARLRWRPLARADLLDIYEAIGNRSPAAAERLYDTIEAKARLLVDHPRLGPRRPDLGPSARVPIVGWYLLLYQTHPDTDEGPVRRVEIVRVVDGRRDLPRLFAPGAR